MALVRSPRMRSAERREQLLDVTLDLVVERGFHAVTIEAIAQGAGVTRPIVYKQFTDLSGLVEALIDREEHRAITQLARAIPDTPRDAAPPPRRNVLKQLEKLVAWGIERRGGPKDLDSELFARLLMEMAEDSARLILTQPEKFTIERIVSFAKTLMGAVQRA